mmetsp:Transcript_99450/g.221922  ORF Transcript_99450/g.221922 Transcript_99450/m.221922 type:complete len:392 (-) Transcript_99450:906-2081(-)
MFGLNDDLPQLLSSLLRLLCDVIVVGDRLVDVERVLRGVFHNTAEVLNPGQLRLQVSLSFLDLEGIAILLELVKATLDHVVRVGSLKSQQVNEHVVAQVEGAGDLRGSSHEHRLRHLRLDLLVEHDDGQASVILPAAPRSAAHLNVLPREEDAILDAIPLASVREHHGLCRHVDTHGKGLCGEQHLDQRLLEQDLNDLFQHRQQAAVVDPQATAQKRKHALDLWQLPIFVAKSHDGVVEDLVDELLLLVIGDVHLLERDCVGLAFLSAEREDDEWQIPSVAAHPDNLLKISAIGTATLLLHLLCVDVVGIGGLLQRPKSFVEVVFTELPLLVHNHVDPIPTGREEVVLERHWPLLGIDDVARLVLDTADPLCELPGIRDCGAEKDESHGVG